MVSAVARVCLEDEVGDASVVFKAFVDGRIWGTFTDGLNLVNMILAEFAAIEAIG